MYGHISRTSEMRTHCSEGCPHYRGSTVKAELYNTHEAILCLPKSYHIHDCHTALLLQKVLDNIGMPRPGGQEDRSPLVLTGGMDNMQCQVNEYSCREHTMENSRMLRVLPLIQNIFGTCVL